MTVKSIGQQLDDRLAEIEQNVHNLLNKPKLSPTYIVGTAFVEREITKWCPYIGGEKTTVQFRATGKMVCLGCGDNH